MMEIIIAILIIILIFGLIFINSVRDYRIKKLEGDVEEIYRKTDLNIKKQKHSDRSGLPSSWGSMEEHERAPKRWSPFYDNSDNSAKITSIILETNGNRMLKMYTTLTPDVLTARHSVDSDLLLFPQTDEVGHFQGDCVVRWKDIARIIEEDKGETK